MSKSSSFGNIVKTKYTSNNEHDQEPFYLLFQGRMESLEDIADQIDKFEQWEPRWDKLKMAMSASGAIFLAIAGILLPILLVKPAIDLWVLIILWSLFFLSAGTLLGTYYANSRHAEERKAQYQNEAQKMKKILQRVKETLRTDSNKPIT